MGELENELMEKRLETEALHFASQSGAQRTSLGNRFPDDLQCYRVIHSDLRGSGRSVCVEGAEHHLGSPMKRGQRSSNRCVSLNRRRDRLQSALAKPA